jgi:hypothetical protein
MTCSVAISRPMMLSMRNVVREHAGRVSPCKALKQISHIRRLLSILASSRTFLIENMKQKLLGETKIVGVYQRKGAARGSFSSYVAHLSSVTPGRPVSEPHGTHIFI